MGDQNDTLRVVIDIPAVATGRDPVAEMTLAGETSRVVFDVPEGRAQLAELMMRLTELMAAMDYAEQMAQAIVSGDISGAALAGLMRRL